MSVNLFKCTNCNKEFTCQMDSVYVCKFCKSNGSMKKIDLRIIKDINLLPTLTDVELRQEHYKVHKLYSIVKREIKYKIPATESLKTLQTVDLAIKKELDVREAPYKIKMKTIELIITPMKLKRNKLQDALGICNCGQAMYYSESKKIMYCPKCHPEIGKPKTYDPNEDFDNVKPIPTLLQKTINKYPKVSSKQIAKRIVKEKSMETVPEMSPEIAAPTQLMIPKRTPKKMPKKIRRRKK